MRVLLSAIATLLLASGVAAVDKPTCNGAHAAEISAGCKAATKNIWAINVDAGSASGGTSFTWSSTSSAVSFADASSQTTAVSVSRSSNSCANAHVVLHVIKANSGGTVTCTVDVHITDDTPPTMFMGGAAAYIEHEFGGDDSLPVVATCTAEDLCDDAVSCDYTEVEGEPSSAADADKGMYSLTRKWTATDSCGNVEEFTQVIDVMDETAPVFKPLAETVTYECSETVPACQPEITDAGTPDAAVKLTSSTADSSCEHAYTTINVYSAEDDNGNSATFTQTIQVSDNTAPVLTGTPESDTISISCEVIDLYLPPTVTATDACDVAPVVTYEQVVDAVSPIGEKYSLIRNWQAEDACGNKATSSQTISVFDDEAPTLPGLAPDITEECGAHPPMFNNSDCVKTVFDKCDESPTVGMAETRINGTCANEYQLVHSYTVSDNAGNGAVYSRTVTVVDNSIPVLHGIPADTTTACIPPVAATPTASDACEPEVTSPTLSENKLDADNYNYRFERVWVVTDACGHTDTATQTIQVVDDESPAFAFEPEPVTASCDTVPSPPNQTVTDDCHPYTNPYDADCSAPIPHSYDEETLPGECAEEYQLERTWETTDCSGQSNSHSQLITITSDRPELVGVPADVFNHEFGSALPEVATVTATDDCTDVSSAVEYTARTIQGSCDNVYDVLRTWSVSDGCGVPTTATQTIYIVDTTPPVVAAVADRTSTCNADPTEWTSTATDLNYTKEELTVEVTCDEDVIGSCDHTGSRTCEFSTVDSCGHTHSVSATDNWDDTTPPTLTCSATMDYNATLNSNGTVTADDNCDKSVEVDYESSTSLGNECSLISTFHEIWSATDVCGNVATECKENTPEWDTTPPTLDPPANETYACRTDTIPDHGDLNGTDDYAGQTYGDDWTTDTLFSRTRNQIDQSACGFTWKTVWVGSDCTGNSKKYTHVAVVTEPNEDSDVWFELNGVKVVFSDDTALSYNAGYDVSHNRSYDIECPEEPAADVFEVHTTCDGKLGDITPTKKTITPAVPRTEDVTVYEYTWSWSDPLNCHTILQTQTVAVIDTTPPIISVSDATGECTVDEAAAAATATDDCDSDVTCESTEDLSGVREDKCYTVIKNWVCTDDNGLTDSAVQTISVYDEAAPVFDTHPDDKIGHCKNLTFIPEDYDLDYTDNCNMGGSITSTHREIDGVGEAGVMARWEYTWVVNDDCGAYTEQQQSVKVMDVLAPNWVVTPPDVTQDCGPTIGDTPTCADDCQADCSVEMVYTTDEVSDLCVYQGVVTTMWKTYDMGGNEDNYTQVVTYKDDEPPSVDNYTITEDIYYIYNESLSTGFDGWDTETNPAALFTPRDNCGPDDAVVTCNYTSSGDHCQTIKTWSCVVTDACGSSTDLGVIRKVYLQDPRNPGLFDPDSVEDSQLSSIPADVTIECDEEIPAMAALTSNVGAVTNSTYDGEAGDYRACRLRIYSWSVQYCSRVDSWHQTITIQDNKAPVITDPVYQSTECSLVPKGSPTVTDTCQGVITPTVTDETTVIGTDDCGLSVVRTIDAVDNCGNRAIKRTSITVLDVTEPVIHGASPDYTMEAPATPNPVTLTATDNCEVVTLEYTEETIQGTCPHDYDVVRSWVATDLCGNTDNQAQTIEISDNTPPEFSAYPPNTTRFYDNPYDEVDRDLWDLNEVPVLTAADDADGDMGTITPNEYYDDTAGLGNFTKYRIWSVTDSCGNVKVHPTQTIVVSLPPCQVQDINVPCADSGELTSGGLYDPQDWINNCTTHLAEAVDIDYTMETAESTGCENEYDVIRTYTLTDKPGTGGSEESLVVTQTITIFDTQDPYFYGLPTLPYETVNKTYDDCDIIVPTFTAADICGSVTVTKVTDKSNDEVWPTVYTATDACGNNKTYTYTQNVLHNAIPQWDAASLPSDQSMLDLCADPALPQPTCTGQCGFTATVTVSTHDVTGSCPSTSVRKWTCTDDYGQAIHYDQTVTFEDQTDPVVITSNNVECSCYTSGTTDNTYNTNDTETNSGTMSTSSCEITATASDNCDGVLAPVDEGCTLTSSNEVFDLYTCTFSISDTCGNTHVDSSTRKMFHNTEPVWTTIVEDYTSECTDIAFDTPAATDDCDAATLTLYETSERVDLENCNSTTELYKLVRTFTVTDRDNAAITQQQTITVHDNSPPQLFGAHMVQDDSHHQCELPDIPVTVSDNCDTTLTGAVTPVVTPTPAPRGYFYNFKWIVQDECGHVTIDEIDIRREDTTDPVFLDTSGQQDLTILCHDSIPTRTDPTWEDNCDVVLGTATLDYTESIVGQPCDGQTNTRTWVITDTVGNTATHVQVIEWNTRTEPVCKTERPDELIECSDEYSDPLITCDDPCTDGYTDIGYTKDTDQHQMIAQCGDNEDGWMRFTSNADQCGRTKLIKVRRNRTDTNPPVYDTFPVGGWKACEYMTYDEPTASDLCGDVTITEVPSGFENDDDCGGFMNITYTATDECGLETVDWFVRTWTDVVPPVLDDKPTSHSIECTESFPIYNIDSTDNCDGPRQDVNHTTTDITARLPFSSDPAITKVVQYDWVVHDDCGLEDSHRMTVIQQDTTPPTINGEFDPVVVECQEYSVPSAVATDACDMDPHEFWSTEKVASCGHTGTIVVTYTAVDFAGLTDVEYKTITIVDITAPSITFSGPKDDVTLECSDPTYVPPTCTAHAEACVGAATPECVQTSQVLAFTKTSSITEYTWTAGDDCGNVVTTTQTVTTVDTTAPEIQWEPYIYKDCTLAGFEAEATAGDNCHPNPTLWKRNNTFIHACTGTYNETFWWVADDEFNRNETETIVIYTDTTPPVLTVVGDDTTSECDVDIQDPTATCADDCSPCSVQLVNISGYDNDECKNYEQTFTFSLYDDCGNEGDPHTVTHTYQDTTPPIITATGEGSDLSYTISAGVAHTAMPTMDTYDACSGATFTFDTTETASADGCTSTHVRTWYSDDACGNQDYWTQTITVEEDVKPHFTGVVDSITVECGVADFMVEVPKPVATDREGNFLEVDSASTTTQLSDCGCDKRHIVYWSTVDDCDNSQTAVTTVVVEDTTPPSFTCVPDDQRVQCATERIDSVVTATDVSVAGFITATHSHVDLDIGCGQSIIRTYTATDCSSNTNTYVQTILVKDDDTPVFTRLPADETIECGCDTIPPQASIAAVDNCDGAITVVPTENKVGTGHEHSLQRTFSVTDACGNAVEAYQTITVEDNTPPTIHGCGVQADIESVGNGTYVLDPKPCESVAMDGTLDQPTRVYADDDCDANPSLDYTQSKADETCTGSFTVKHQWQSCDATGNCVTATESQPVYDNTAPDVLPTDNLPECFSNNGKYWIEDVDVMFPWYDNCDSDDTVTLEMLSCNATQVAAGASGAWTDDCVLSEDKTQVSIKGEATSSTDRTYTVYASLTDTCGNSRTVSKAFTVIASDASASTAGCEVPTQAEAHIDWRSG